MKALRYVAIAALLTLVAIPAMTVSAQGPIQKRVNFWINVPFELGEGEMILPAGKYELYQISANDLNLFALYREDRTSSPIAMIRTVRIDYLAGEGPDETKMLVTNDGESAQSYPVIEGWAIPGMDGWKILSVKGESSSMISNRISKKAYGKKQKVHVVTTSSGY